ncbi:hypothetical protein V6N13_064287 [Hibiscus sabdariffa]|uniref:Uncharacterized protein n=1 Tax=Hibiscus sabdariffa TaxID=183260 RepID=A0ABR2E9I8_9ROSI
MKASGDGSPSGVRLRSLGRMMFEWWKVVGMEHGDKHEGDVAVMDTWGLLIKTMGQQLGVPAGSVQDNLGC